MPELLAPRLAGSLVVVSRIVVSRQTVLSPAVPLWRVEQAVARAQSAPVWTGLALTGLALTGRALTGLAIATAQPAAAQEQRVQPRARGATVRQATYCNFQKPKGALVQQPQMDASPHAGVTPALAFDCSLPRALARDALGVL